jgi:hypothetical protein
MTSQFFMKQFSDRVARENVCTNFSFHFKKNQNMCKMHFKIEKHMLPLPKEYISKC